MARKKTEGVVAVSDELNRWDVLGRPGTDITPEMFAAGLEALGFYPEFAEDATTVRRVFRAMCEARAAQNAPTTEMAQ